MYGWTNRRTDRRQMDKWANRRTDRWTDGQSQIRTYRRTDGWTNRSEDRHRNGDRNVDRKMDGWTNRRTDRQKDGRMNEDRRIDAFTNRWTDRPTDGQADGKMDEGMKRRQKDTDDRIENTLTIAPVPTVIFAVTSPIIRDTQIVGTLKPVTEAARLI